MSRPVAWLRLRVDWHFCADTDAIAGRCEVSQFHSGALAAEYPTIPLESTLPGWQP
jgi:hypothetical protein